MAPVHLVLHPDLVPDPRRRALVDLGSGARIEVPARTFDLAQQFVQPADVASVLREIPDARTEVAGLAARDILVTPPGRPPPPRLGLFDAPRGTLAQALTLARPSAVVFGLPYDAGASGRGGARDAPDAVRRTSTDLYVHDPLGRRGWHDPRRASLLLDGVGLVDVGDLCGSVVVRNGPELDRLQRAVELVVDSGRVPVVLGGDHSIALPAILGCAAARPVGVLHLDAHADIDVSQEPGAVSEADWRARSHHGTFMSWVAASEHVRAVVQVGMRQRTPVPVPLPEGVVRLPGRPAADEVLTAMDPTLDWYVTLDVDVLDPSILRGTGTPLPGGYGAAELLDLLGRVAAERRVVGFDVCELIPDHDTEALLAADIVLTLLSGCCGANAPGDREGTATAS